METANSMRKAKKVIEKVQPDFPDLEVEYIGVTQHPEILQQYRVLSAPGIVINGKRQYTGGSTKQPFANTLKAICG